jgi:hypothetical protein
MIPGGLYLLLSFYSQRITSVDIRRQMWKEKKISRRLAEALKADGLAMEAERNRSQD